jgi:hypothetical protein
MYFDMRSAALWGRMRNWLDWNELRGTVFRFVWMLGIGAL